jgi:hypothetical protein
MEQEKLEKLLNELTAKTTEPVRPGLAEEIKKQIPQKLSTHRGGRDTFNIVIDLRVSKLAAAAAIILTMLLWANLFERGDSMAGSFYSDCKFLLKHRFGSYAGELSVAKSRYDYLIEKGKEVAYYGNSVNPKDSNVMLLQWKLSDGSYRIIFANLREETVTAEQLIKLQSKMLQKRK